MSQIAIGEAFENAITTMSEYVNEVKAEVDKIFDDFYQVAVNDHPWEVLYKTAAKLEETYNAEVLGGIKKQINDWAEGEGSYVKLTVRFRMGEDAENEAKKQQGQIVDEIENIQEITKFSEANPDFSNTHFELEAVKTRLEEISNNTDKLKVPEIKPDDYQLLVYLCCGLSPRTISLLLEESVEVIYKRKSRLKARLKEHVEPQIPHILSIF